MAATPGTNTPALLMTVMEPPPLLVDEFNDWADTEHVPERARLPGFAFVQRYVCTDGWPRYMTRYDLDSMAVLETPAYRAIAGDNLSPWSKRMLRAVSGQWRFSGPQIDFDVERAVSGSAAGALLLVRWRNATLAWRDLVVRGLRAGFAERPGIRQVKVFAMTHDAGVDYLGLVEGALPPNRADLDLAELGESAAAIDLVNVYAPYWKRGASPPVTR